MYCVDEDVPDETTLKSGKGGSSGGGVFLLPLIIMESCNVSSSVKLFLSTVAVTETFSPKQILLRLRESKREKSMVLLDLYSLILPVVSLIIRFRFSGLHSAYIF